MFALPFAFVLKVLHFQPILISDYYAQMMIPDFSEIGKLCSFLPDFKFAFYVKRLFDVVVCDFFNHKRSFLIFALHLLFSFQGTELFCSFQNRFQKNVFVILLKSALKLSGPKWTRTTDLTLIRRAL